MVNYMQMLMGELSPLKPPFPVPSPPAAPAPPSPPTLDPAVLTMPHGMYAHWGATAAALYDNTVIVDASNTPLATLSANEAYNISAGAAVFSNSPLTFTGPWFDPQETGPTFAYRGYHFGHYSRAQRGMHVTGVNVQDDMTLVYVYSFASSNQGRY